MDMDHEHVDTINNEHGTAFSNHVFVFSEVEITYRGGRFLRAVTGENESHIMLPSTSMLSVGCSEVHVCTGCTCMTE